MTTEPVYSWCLSVKMTGKSSKTLVPHRTNKGTKGGDRITVHSGKQFFTFNVVLWFPSIVHIGDGTNDSLACKVDDVGEASGEWL